MRFGCVHCKFGGAHSLFWNFGCDDGGFGLDSMRSRFLASMCVKLWKVCGLPGKNLGIRCDSPFKCIMALIVKVALAIQMALLCWTCCGVGVDCVIVLVT